jgi:hypothetical protein
MMNQETDTDIVMAELRPPDLSEVIPVLMEQRRRVAEAGAEFAAHLIDLAIMQLRLTVNGISEEELSGFSDFIGDRMVRDENLN